MTVPTIHVTTATPSQFTQVAELARRIWPICFGALISREQCEYMLRQRYTAAAMAEAVASGMTYELIHWNSQVAGFGAHGPATAPGEWKLWQAYVLPEHQGHGLGRHYIHHVAQAARLHGRSHLVLTVNKRNDRARALYERCGFLVRDSACFDIGNGFVMDDFVMAKPLADGDARD